jgi:hypothetical protein
MGEPDARTDPDHPAGHFVAGALPVYPYSRRWGYFPGGLLTLILVVFIVLLLIGAIDFSGNANT